MLTLKIEFMKLKIPFYFFLNTFLIYGQCTINDATDCQCLDPNQLDCDLLPDIQVSWVGLESVLMGHQNMHKW